MTMPLSNDSNVFSPVKRFWLPKNSSQHKYFRLGLRQPNAKDASISLPHTTWNIFVEMGCHVARYKKSDLDEQMNCIVCIFQRLLFQ